MARGAEFERQRLLTERLADEQGVEVLRQIAVRFGDPGVVAGFYCLVFQQIFEQGLRRAHRRARDEDAAGWVLALTKQILDEADEDSLPHAGVEPDLATMLAGGVDAIDHVPPSLIVRNVQFIRASFARARANLHHRGPAWLKLAVTLTVLFGAAAVVWGAYGYLKAYDSDAVSGVSAALHTVVGIEVREQHE